MHVDLIVPFSKSIIQHQTDSGIIKNNVSLACMKMIDAATGWFEIVEIPMYKLDEVTGSNVEYIYKSYIRVRHFLTTHGLADNHIHAKSCLTKL